MAAPLRFQRLYPPAVPTAGPAHWVLFSEGALLFSDGAPVSLHEGTHERPAVSGVAEAYLLGQLADRPLFLGVLAPGAPVPAGLRSIDLRSVLAQADAELGGLAGYAAQILRWTRTSRFCPACATPLQALDGWGKACPACGHSMYPPVSPATIVLIHDGGDRVLLTSKAGWGDRYSLVAGFVEPGETLEECVAREVREEVGVEVGEVRYVGSQPWPFPQQLMLGFTARYAGGDIVVDRSELTDARWFHRDALPALPPPFSIARQIIQLWLEQ